jgi:hypothetical protein
LADLEAQPPDGQRVGKRTSGEVDVDAPGQPRQRFPLRRQPVTLAVRAELERRARIAEQAGLDRSHLPAGIPGPGVGKAVGEAGIGRDEFVLQVQVLQHWSGAGCPHHDAYRAPIGSQAPSKIGLDRGLSSISGR